MAENGFRCSTIHSGSNGPRSSGNPRFPHVIFEGVPANPVTARGTKHSGGTNFPLRSHSYIESEFTRRVVHSSSTCKRILASRCGGAHADRNRAFCVRLCFPGIVLLRSVAPSLEYSLNPIQMPTSGQCWCDTVSARLNRLLTHGNGGAIAGSIFVACKQMGCS